MSFTALRGTIEKQMQPAIVSSFEYEYLKRVDPDLHDQVVEMLVDRIRQDPCLFAFKNPLGAEFSVARDHAINCIEFQHVPSRRVKEWISDCLKCMDCVLLVYIRDVLKVAVPCKPDRRPRERDVYDRYENQGEPLSVVGECFNNIYQKRSQLEHLHVTTEAGERKIQEVSGSKKKGALQFTFAQLKTSLGVMVPLYREAFPGHCLDTLKKGGVA